MNSKTSLFTSLFILIIVAAFSSSAFALSADSKYITVLKDGGPISDVVNAANFAAAMQAEAGVAFTGATDAQLNSLPLSDDRLLVYFDGKNAKIVESKSVDDMAVSALAAAYLRTQGFSVTTETQTTDASGAGDDASQPAPDTAPEQPDCSGCSTEGVCFSAGQGLGDEVCMPDGQMVKRRSSGAECKEDYECSTKSCMSGTCRAPGEAPSITPPTIPNQTTPSPDSGSVPVSPSKPTPTLIERIIGWFSHLFG
jgi:hypothetical protein